MNFKNLMSATAFALAAISASVAHAYPTYSATFQGATFNIEQTTDTSFNFQILISPALSGDWAGATWLNSFDFKGLGIDFTQAGAGATATILAPLGTGTTSPFDGTQGQLNGQTCNTNVGETGSICFTPSPHMDVASEFLFDIDIIGGQILDFASLGPHLQIMWTAEKCTGGSGPNAECFEDKVGSLYSQDIGLGSSSSSSTSSGDISTSSGVIPEPSTNALALLGLALVAGSFAMRRKAVAGQA